MNKKKLEKKKLRQKKKRWKNHPEELIKYLNYCESVETEDWVHDIKKKSKEKK